MINFRKSLCKNDGRLEPSKNLNIEICIDQFQLLNFDEKDLRKSTVFQDAMQNSIRKLATSNLNVIGNMVEHCSVLTSEENLKRDTEDVQLASIYENITEGHKYFKSLKYDKLKYSVNNALPSAITKLKTNNCDYPAWASGTSEILRYFTCSVSPVQDSGFESLRKFRKGRFKCLGSRAVANSHAAG